jgi:hypothetical protein
MTDISYDTIADQVENASTALDAYEQHLFPGEPIVHREGHEDSEVMLRSLLCDLLHYADHQQIDFATTFTVARQLYIDDLTNSRRLTTTAAVRQEHPEPAPAPDSAPAPATARPEVTPNSSAPAAIHPAALAAQAFPNPLTEGVPTTDPEPAADRPANPVQRPGNRRP